MLTEEELQKYLWIDFSIIKHNDAIMVLLIFKTMADGEHFMSNILAKNEFRFECVIDENTGRYKFNMHFFKPDISITNDTGKTLKDYPPFAWLGLGTPTYITNGIWEPGKKGKFKFNSDLFPLDESFNGITFEEGIQNQFSKAKNIQFWEQEEKSLQ